MKKMILIAIAVIGFGWQAESQVNSQVIGLRLGGGYYGAGAELSYQHGLGEANRLELDLGLVGSSNYRHFLATGIYQWVWNIKDGLNWYAGAGVQIGGYRYSHTINHNERGLALAVGGQAGIEYDLTEFDVPLLISLDTRPMWSLSGYYSGVGYGGALGIRYIL